MSIPFEQRLARESLGPLLGCCQPMEVQYLLDRLRAGEIDGSSPLDCLIGHVAHLRGQTYCTSGLAFGYSWEHPQSTFHIEQWVRYIHIGDTPRDHAHAQLLESWLVAWLEERTIEVPMLLLEKVT